MRTPKKWIYIFSFLPGWGQLYLGLMNRGLQFMLLFWGGMFLAVQSNLESFLVFLPVLVFYSYYDALQHYRSILEYGETTDDSLFDWKILKEKKYLIGWVLIVIGLFSFFQMMMWYLPSEITRYIPYGFLQQSLVAIIFIGLGFKLLRGEKEKERVE